MSEPSSKILVVFGTRPEAIKMAPVVLALQSSRHFEPIVCVTAQHREMLDQVLQVFSIEPDVDLDIMKPSQDLFDVTSSVLVRMRDVIQDQGPVLTMVHGDTTTTLAASLASFYSNVPVAHVEAGLRTYDLAAPFPEEANRQLTSRLARYHFAPTDGARDNLAHEGTDAENICVTGNTVVDSLVYTADLLRADTTMQQSASNAVATAGYTVADRNYILVTGHRRESFGRGLENTCEALSTLAREHPDIDIVYPVHLNPNVRGPVHRTLGTVSNIHLIDPLHYQAFVYLMMNCHFVITDSGGIQEEAPSLNKPVLVTRDVTERPEGVAAGVLKMVGTDTARIVATAEELLDSPSAYGAMSSASNPYGDGHAAARIVNYLEGSTLADAHDR